MASFAETHDTTVTIILKEGIELGKNAGDEFQKFGIDTLDRLITRASEMGNNAWDSSYPCQFAVKCVDPQKKKFRVTFEWSKAGCIIQIVDLLSAHDQVKMAKRGM